MRTFIKRKGLPMWVSSLIVLGFLVACGQSQAEIDAARARQSEYAKALAQRGW